MFILPPTVLTCEFYYGDSQMALDQVQSPLLVLSNQLPTAEKQDRKVNHINDITKK